MIKRIVTLVIRKTKNKDFVFDEILTNSSIVGLILDKALSLFRGLRFLFHAGKFNMVYLGKNVKIRFKKNIQIGDNVVVGDYVSLVALGKSPLSIGSNVSIGAFSQLVISTSYNNIGEFIKIGDHVGFGEFAYLGGAGGLEIGENTVIGQYFSAHPENHNFRDSDTLIRFQGVNRQGIKIGSNCWIGSNVTILDGVTVGNNCVIAAGAVVNSSFGDNLVIGGVPASVLTNI